MALKPDVAPEMVSNVENMPVTFTYVNVVPATDNTVPVAVVWSPVIVSPTVNVPVASTVVSVGAAATVPIAVDS